MGSVHHCFLKASQSILVGRQSRQKNNGFISAVCLLIANMCTVPFSQHLSSPTIISFHQLEIGNGSEIFMSSIAFHLNLKERCLSLSPMFTSPWNKCLMVRKCYNGVFLEKQLRKTYHLITLVFFSFTEVRPLITKSISQTLIWGINRRFVHLSVISHFYQQVAV